MYLNDIITIFFLCAVVMLPLGYVLRDHLPKWKGWLSAYLLAPRYLKKHGVSSLSNSTTSEHKHE